MQRITRAAFAAWACLAALAAPGGAFAQTAAEGAYPGVVSCDPSPKDRGPLRAAITVEIAAGRARYASGPESGAGAMTGRQLVLTGRGPGYEARYVGEVGGKGGLLTGARTSAGSRRACQILLGDGRG